MFKFPSNRAYSSRTSCSSGVRVSSVWSGLCVCEAERCCSGVSEAMFCVPWARLCSAAIWVDVVVGGWQLRKDGQRYLVEWVFTAVR